MFLNRLPHLGDALSPVSPTVRRMGGVHCSFRPHHEHLLEVADRLIGPGPVGFVDDEDVADLEEAGLVGLHAVAPPGVEDHDGGVGRFDDLDLGLTDPDGLDDHKRFPDGVEHGDHPGGRLGDAPEVAATGHRPHVDAGIADVVLHPDPVAEDRSSRERAGRIDGEDRHFVAVSTDQRDELVGEGALAGAGGTGESDHVGVPGARIQLAEEFLGSGASIFDEADQPGQGASISIQGTFEELVRIRHGRKGSARSPDPRWLARIQVASTPTTPGTRSVRIRSIPALSVIIDMGQPPQAPTISRLTMPFLDTEQHEVATVGLKGRADVLEGRLEGVHVDGFVGSDRGRSGDLDCYFFTHRAPSNRRAAAYVPADCRPAMSGT